MRASAGGTATSGTTRGLTQGHRTALTPGSLPGLADWGTTDRSAKYLKGYGRSVLRGAWPVLGGGDGGGDRAGQELGDVDDLEGFLGFAGGLFGADRVAEHDQAVRARGGDGVRVQGQGFLDPLGVDPLADALFHPHPGAARAAAEAALLAAVHLFCLYAGDGLEDLAGRGEDAVVAAQEAGGAGRHDRLGRGLVEGLDVLLGQHLVHELVADAAGRVAGAGLGRAEHRERDPGGVP